MNPPIQAAFFSSFKVDRTQRLAEQLITHHIQLAVVNLPSRSPLIIFKKMLSYHARCVLLTHDWLSFAFLMSLVHLIRGNPYILVLTSLILDARKRNPSRVIPLSIYQFGMLVAMHRSCAVICNSRYLENEYRKEFPQFKDKFTTIYNGIDIPSKPPEKYYLYPEGSLNLVTVTNFEYPHKFIGLDVLLDGLQQTKVSGLHLFILGKVLSERGNQNLQSFQKRAEEQWKGIKINIIPNADVFSFFQPDKAYFLYSSGPRGDSLPRAILEAQAVGMPCLVVDTNGCAEGVLPGKSAIVVAPSPSEIARGFHMMINADHKAMSVAAQQNIQENFSWLRMASKYAQVIHACLSTNDD